MRLLPILIALLGLSAADARADVFVPADPPDAATSDCATASGDVYAARSNGPAQVRVGGGALATFDGLNGCPTVVAAADGTAAVVADQPAAMIVRRPGGAFGPPIALAEESNSGASVAVAPGGWVVATWTDEAALMALVVRPDGSTSRTTVESLGPDATVIGVQPGIDATGAVTIVVRQYERRSSREHVRIARSVNGGAPVIAADLPVAEPPAGGPVDPRDGGTQVDLTVAPGGGTLLGWADREGVHVMVDGGAPQLLDSSSTSVLSLSASLGDDGTALISYLRSDDELVAVERFGGAWRSPRVLWAGPNRQQRYGSDTSGRVVHTLLGAGGRVAVVWATTEEDEPHIFGMLGQVGGSWGPAARLSSIARAAYVSSLSLDAAGIPRVLWSESEAGVRGATVAAARSDVTAPVVAVRFPSRLPRTRTGRVTLSVRVRCSEACDAALSVAFPSGYDELDGGAFDRQVRAIGAGRSHTFRLRMRAEIARQFVRDPSARRLHLRLVATDRAGNVVRRRGSVRVRVIEKPIRSLKVAPDHSFGMKTAAGNRLVVALVNDLIERAARGGASEESLHRVYARGRAAIRRAGHREISSQRVRRRIDDALDIPLTRAGVEAGYVTSS